MGRTKLMFSFAAFGFLIGTAAYFIFNWFATNNIITIASVPISEILFSPWFLSGIAGSLLSIIIISAFAHFSSDK